MVRRIGREEPPVRLGCVVEVLDPRAVPALLALALVLGPVTGLDGPPDALIYHDINSQSYKYHQRQDLYSWALHLHFAEVKRNILCVFQILEYSL